MGTVPEPAQQPAPDDEDDRTPFQRFEDLARRLVHVPKREVRERRTQRDA